MKKLFGLYVNKYLQDQRERKTWRKQNAQYLRYGTQMKDSKILQLFKKVSDIKKKAEESEKMVTGATSES